MKYTYILLFVLSIMITGCGSRPEGWDAVKMPSVTTEQDINSVYVNANSADWTNGGSYDNKYTYQINIEASSPSYSKTAPRAKALALGTASFCNYQGNLGDRCKNSVLPGVMTKVGVVTFPKSMYNKIISVDNENQCILPLLPGKNYLDPNKNEFKNGIITSLITTLGFYCRVNNTSDFTTCTYCCISPQTYYITYGCTTTKGAPYVAGTKTGMVEYKISATKPQITDRGNILQPFTSNSVQNPDSGTIWFRIIDEDGDYTNNYGQYEIQVESPAVKENFISKLAKFLITPLTIQISEVSIKFWENTVGNKIFKNLISVMVTLYIIILGVFFALGNIKMTQTEFIIRLLKIGVLYAVISPHSYEFFNKYLFSFFVDGQKYLINIITNPDTSDQVVSSNLNYDTLFGFTNYIISTIFSKHFLLVMVSMLLWFPVGWVVLIFLLAAMFFYTMAIIEAIILYLIAFTAVSFLISLGPIFIILILFERTKNIFNSYIDAIISFTMQPVILFATIMVVTVLINGAIYNIMAISASWECMVDIFLKLPGLNKISLFCINWYKPQASFIDFFKDVLIFYLLIALLRKIPAFANTIGTAIFGGAGMTGASSKAASGMMSSLKAPFAFANTLTKLRPSDFSSLRNILRKGVGGKGAGGVPGSGGPGGGGSGSGGPGGKGSGNRPKIPSNISSSSFTATSSSSSSSASAKSTIDTSSSQRDDVRIDMDKVGSQLKGPSSSSSSPSSSDLSSSSSFTATSSSSSSSASAEDAIDTSSAQRDDARVDMDKVESQLKGPSSSSNSPSSSDLSSSSSSSNNNTASATKKKASPRAEASLPPRQPRPPSTGSSSDSNQN